MASWICPHNTCGHQHLTPTTYTRQKYSTSSHTHYTCLKLSVVPPNTSLCNIVGSCQQPWPGGWTWRSLGTGKFPPTKNSTREWPPLGWLKQCASSPSPPNWTHPQWVLTSFITTSCASAAKTHHTPQPIIDHCNAKQWLKMRSWTISAWYIWIYVCPSAHYLVPTYCS